MANNNRYILGFGNYANGDDGVGLHVIEYIVDHRLDQGFEAIEIGNDGMQLLTYFTEKIKKIVIIDCAYIGKEPGEYLIFDPTEVESQKVVNKVTTHEGDVLKLIELGRQLGYPTPDIQIMAIQPESVEIRMELSKTLQEKLGQYATTCINELLAK